MNKSESIIPIGKIEQRILFLRGEKVIIDADLADFYGVTTKRLNEQVKRNAERFPGDFRFELTPEEKNQLVANCDHLSGLKFSKAMPHAFTEHGAIMAASVLNSTRAVQVSVFIVRAFIKLRQAIGANKELATKIDLLEQKLMHHDQQIVGIVQAIRKLATPKPLPKKRQIGFRVADTDD